MHGLSDQTLSEPLSLEELDSFFGQTQQNTTYGLQTDNVNTKFTSGQLESSFGTGNMNTTEFTFGPAQTNYGMHNMNVFPNTELTSGQLGTNFGMGNTNPYPNTQFASGQLEPNFEMANMHLSTDPEFIYGQPTTNFETGNINLFPNTTSGYGIPEELHPIQPDTLDSTIPIHPTFHPQIGWYWPASSPPGLLPTANPAYPMPLTGNERREWHCPTQTSPATSSTLDNSVKSSESTFSECSSSDQQQKDGFSQLPMVLTPRKYKRKKHGDIVQNCVCNPEVIEKIPRPKNPFILYRSHHAKELLSKNGKNNQTVSKIAGQMWKNETPEVKKKFQKLAAKEKKRHAEKYPNYIFNPGQAKAARFGKKDCTCGAYEVNREAKAKSHACLKSRIVQQNGSDDYDLHHALTDSDSEYTSWLPGTTKKNAYEVPVAQMVVDANQGKTINHTTATSSEPANGAQFRFYSKSKQRAQTSHTELNSFHNLRSRKPNKSTSYVEPQYEGRDGDEIAVSSSMERKDWHACGYASAVQDRAVNAKDETDWSARFANLNAPERTMERGKNISSAPKDIVDTDHSAESSDFDDIMRDLDQVIEWGKNFW